MNKFRKIFFNLTVGLLLLSIVAGSAAAAKSDQIQDEIDDLESEAAEIEEERKGLQTEIQSTDDKMMDTANRKIQVDRDIELLRQKAENLNEQIRQYNILISEKQAVLSEIQGQQEDLLDAYKERMRAIQEHGEISYWSVLLNSDSFADMLTYRVMVGEIKKADELMMSELQEKAAEVLEAKEDLDNERGRLEDKIRELDDDERVLAEKREESDELLTELYEMSSELKGQEEEYESMDAEIHEQIAQKEIEYQKEKQREWEALQAELKAKEEEEKKKQEEENKKPGDNPAEDPGSTLPSVCFMHPLGGAGVVTCPYGYRVHPVTGNYSFHTGVDIGAPQGTPILASRSGYISAAEYNYDYGFMVTINHMDGYSTMYAHMTNFTVSPNQYVEQGQVIGYVGDTGIYSTGPHLHFTIYYNGSTVNPMEYIG